ncbi:MotA/TolQ/ExbB proton channel family protein [Magnetococcus sp. PR-3]|uniref:MotA/TolQ/ExbB proton channel family protein n=1 Tax=Magnetococcus sp. PR-3 TaxID=3120355 RepID=UPI002FCE3BBB
MHDLWFGWWQDADWVVRSVFMTLLFASLISWSVILYKWVQLRHLLHGERTLFTACQDPSTQPVWRSNMPSAQLQAHMHALTAAQHHAIERILAQLLKQQRLKLENGLSILASIAASAPFIGLFGTVWGIMHALQGLGAQSTVSLDLVAGPVAEALVATALGLFAAIPALLGYNMLVRLLKRVMGYLEGIAVYLSVQDQKGIQP